MTAALEMPISLLRFSEREYLIDYRMQAVHGDGPVHRLEIGAAPNANRADRNAATGQQ